MTGPVQPTPAAGSEPAPSAPESTVAGHATSDPKPTGAAIVTAAETAPAPVPPRGMFGVAGSGDTSGFGGLVRRRPALLSTERPFGGWFDEAYDTLERAYPQFGDAVERVVVDRGELTLHIRREALLDVVRVLRDDPSLQFQLLSALSGVDYLDDPTGRRLHVLYHLTSMTRLRRLRLEVSVTAADPHIPSVTGVYPGADWHERETWDFFGVVFDGHPGLTRIFMPDDWEGHPQRKDYPLGGISVEYKGAEVPPPDERRAYA